MNEKTFQAKLRKFSRLLQQEQHFLLIDDGAALTEIVPQKENFLPFFTDYSGPISQSTKQLIALIQDLQQTNLLLTKQAIAYHQKMMATIQQSLARQEGTYSKKSAGQSNKQSPEIAAAIVDQAF